MSEVMPIAIRNIADEDFSGMINLRKKVSKQFPEFMLASSDEISEFYSFDRHLNFIKNNPVLGAFDEVDEIRGFICGIKSSCLAENHKIAIVIGVEAESQGKSIGSKLIDCLVKWALENEIKRIELTVNTKNVRAISLYKRKGFLIEGTKELSLFKNSGYHNEFYMGKIL